MMLTRGGRPILTSVIFQQAKYGTIGGEEDIQHLGVDWLLVRGLLKGVVRATDDTVEQRQFSPQTTPPHEEQDEENAFRKDDATILAANLHPSTPDRGSPPPNNRDSDARLFLRRLYESLSSGTFVKSEAALNLVLHVIRGYHQGNSMFAAYPRLDLVADSDKDFLEHSNLVLQTQFFAISEAPSEEDGHVDGQILSHNYPVSWTT